MCYSIPQFFLWFIDLKMDQFVNLFIALITTRKKMDIQWLWHGSSQIVDFKISICYKENHFYYQIIYGIALMYVWL